MKPDVAFQPLKNFFVSQAMGFTVFLHKGGGG